MKVHARNSGSAAKPNAASDITRKYFAETSIHGLKYIAEPGRHIVERIFWLVAVVSFAVTAGYLIYAVIDKWQTSPVLVSFDSKAVPIWEVPFPSMTICNLNKVCLETLELMFSLLRVSHFLCSPVGSKISHCPPGQ